MEKTRFMKIVDLLDPLFQANVIKGLSAGTHVISQVEYAKSKLSKVVDELLLKNKLDPKVVIVTPTEKGVSEERAIEYGCKKEYDAALPYVDAIKKIAGKSIVVFYLK